MSKEFFFLADYVNDFKCKCGDCRRCCCVGWPVTISYKEYVKLLGLQCNKHLKRRIDCAFYVLSDCTPDRYAEINRTIDGECHLRDADGKCALHKAFGENVLPSVCKMYPRNYKLGGIREGACAMSCEGVLETMFRSTDKLVFHTAEIDVDGPSESYVSLNKDFSEIQKDTIETLQNRDDPMYKRLIKVGVFVNNISELTIKKAAEYMLEEFDKVKPSEEYPALDVALRLADFLNSYSQSFSEFGEAALNNLYYDKTNSTIGEMMERYDAARAHIYQVLPSFDVYMEDIVVNHLFFERFPYSYTGETYRDEYTAFIGVYALVKLVSVGYMMHKNNLSDFVDCVSGLFRYLEHGNANKIITSALSAFSFNTLSNLAALAEL